MTAPVCLGPITQIPEAGSKGFQLGRQSLFAVRRGGRIFVYRNNCPHRGIELEWQPDQFLDAERQFIQCATHGALFLIDTGECISGPCVGDMLEAVNCEIIDDQLWVRL